MRIAHVKRKSVNVMETVTNAENIIPSLNVRDLVKKKKRNEISCLEDSFQFLEVEKSRFVDLANFFKSNTFVYLCCSNWRYSEYIIASSKKRRL